MSYILEALKKSEQERQQGNVPSIQTVSPLLLDSSQSAKWPYWVIGILALSLVFLLGWMRPWMPEGTLTGIRSSAESQERVVADRVQSKPVETVRISEPVTTFIEPQANQESVFTEPSLMLESIPHLRDLPSLVQQAIPDLAFAGHVYTSNPEQRSVIVNGRSMSEGETVVDGLKVEQITSKGVVFSYQGNLFQMPILQDWSFD